MIPSLPTRIQARTIKGIMTNGNLIPSLYVLRYFNRIWKRKQVVHHAPIVLPKAAGMDDMELGGITPTSVTTAVMYDGGVRS